MCKFIWQNCIISYTGHVAALALNFLQSCEILKHSITSPQAKEDILPLRGKHYCMLIKTINMLINNFRAIWAKPSKMKSFTSESQQYPHLQLYYVFQCSWFLQGHSQSWGVAMVRRGWVQQGAGEDCTLLDPAGSLGASVITYLIKDKTAVQQLWEKTMRKKGHERNVVADIKVREECGTGGLAATPFPHAMDCLAEREAEKNRKKWVNLSLWKREVRIRRLQFWFYFSLSFY